MHGRKKTSRSDPDERDKEKGRRVLRWMQIEAINRLKLPTVVLVDGHGVRGSTIKSVLRIVDDFARKSGACWASGAVIAEKTGLKLRTVRRALKAATQLQLLIRAPARTSHGYRQVSYRICWSIVMPETEEAAPAESSEPSAPGAPPSAPGAPPSAPGAPPSAPGAPPSETVIETVNETSPPPSPSSGTTEEELSVNLEMRILELGVNHPRDTLRRARESHADSTIWAIVEHFDRHRLECGWSPGALVVRLRSQRAEIAEGWPAPDETAIARQRENVRREHDAREAAAVQARRVEKQQQQQAARELESDWGAVLDRRAADQTLAPLVARLTDLERVALARAGAPLGLVRIKLLKHLKDDHDNDDC